MKRIVSWLLVAGILLTCFAAGFAEETEEEEEGFLSGVGSWFSNAGQDVANWATDTAGNVADWTSNAASDVGEWVSNAAGDVWDWTTGAANSAWNWTVGATGSAWKWTVQTANGTWDGISGFFNPPSTEGTPTISIEPDLPEGTLKMYLGYPAVKTGLNNGFHNVLEITKDDPHFGISMGKFYVSGFTGVTSEDGEHFIFLKTVGDEVQLHFELTQDIDMINKDSFLTISSDYNAYDREMGVTPTDFGRGTLIVKFTDYQNKTSEPQVYTNYLEAKQTGTADTIISLNEEGDYEIALDYQLKKDSYVLGTSVTNSSYTDYRIHFTFSVRNGNCMVFPFDLVTGEELKNTSIAPNGFKLDLAYSRYLNINVKRSTLTEGAAGVVEDVRFNRPARDGEEYSQEGIYTIMVQNEYTDQETVKTIYVGSDEKLIDYVTQGYTLDQILQTLNNQ